MLLPLHQYFGSSILVLAAAAALMGHLEKAIWSNKGYSLKNPEAVLVNVTGLLIILFVMGVTFLLSTFKKDEPDKRWYLMFKYKYLYYYYSDIIWINLQIWIYNSGLLSEYRRET